MSEGKLENLYRQKNPSMSEQKKQTILENLWLTYFNDTLFANGIITEDIHNKMRVKIKTRKGNVMR